MTVNRPRLPGRYRAFVYAVLVHIAVVGLLIIGFRFSGGDLPLPKGKPVQAVAVEDPEKRKQEDEKKRQAEDKRKQDEARKQEEAERQRAEQARKAEAERKAEEKRWLVQKQKEEAEKKRQAEAKRKQEEEQAERRKKEEAERRLAAEESLKQQIAAEERASAEAARAARAASAADKYKALIRQKVSRNWNRPAGTKTGLKCTVRVRLVPGGEVLQATVVRSSGDAVFDRSVENAVYKAAPLPLPPDADLFDYFREIEFLFSPEA